MGEMQKKYSEEKEVEISSFAFDVGRSIETFIRLATDNLEDKNKNYEMQILAFRDIIVQKEDAGLLAEYYRHFNIKTADGSEGPTT